jgi:hypothetical protein
MISQARPGGASGSASAEANPVRRNETKAATPGGSGLLSFHLTVCRRLDILTG